MAHIKTLALVAMTASAFATSALAFGESGGQGGQGGNGGNNSASGSVNVTGSVASNCAFTGQSTVNLALGELAGQDGTLNASVANSPPYATLAGWCNSAGSTMSVSATKMNLQNAPQNTPAGFITQLNYKASATVGSTTATYDTAVSGSQAGASKTVNAFSSNNIQVGVAFDTANGLLLSGTYGSTISVTLTPGS
jgi:hypothetical protein